MKLKSILFIAIITLISQASYGQYNSGTKKKNSGHGAREPHHSVIKGGFKLPTPIGNKAFRRIMNGVTDSDFSYNYRLSSNFTFGAGIKYGLWDIDVNQFSGDAHGKMEILNPFVSFSKVFEEDKQFYVETEFKVGYNMITTKSNLGAPYKQTGLNFEPKVGFYLKASDMLAFGLNINYNYIQTNFSRNNMDLSLIAIDHYPGVNASEEKGATQYFSVGFGFYAFIPNKDDRAAAKDH